MAVLHELHTILQRLDYPLTREEIIAAVRDAHVPEEHLRRVQSLPEHMYGSVDSVMDALRGLD